MQTGREHLAAAHQELAAAEDRLQRIEAALAATRTGDLTEKRDAAERTLAAARDQQPQAWVDALTSGRPPPDHVARAEAKLAEVVAAEETALESRRLLRAEETRVRDLVERCRVRVHQEAVAVIRASPEAAALRDEVEAAERRIEEISEVARQLPGAIGLRYVRPAGADVDRTMARTWAAAVAELERDPNTELPSHVDP
jgi:DNA repair exonuclease SbcCD ATPase subunit